MRRGSQADSKARLVTLLEEKTSFKAKVFKRPDDKPVKFGSLKFPASKQPPAKWACIGPIDERREAEQIECLHDALLKDWQMPKPRVIISIVGSDDDTESEVLEAQQQLVFRRGLLKAARTTQAWIVTSGTACGVMAMVGRELKTEIGDSEKEIVCLGIGPWDRIALRHQMERQPNGTVFSYQRPLQASSKDAAIRAGPYGARSSGQSDASEEEEEELFLDSNHSHFLLVDDPDDEEGSSEMDLRSKLEKRLCTSTEKDENPKPNVSAAGSSFSNSLDEGKVETPGVVIMVGGDERTLAFVRRSLEDRRPVIVVADSKPGSAAFYLWLTSTTIDAILKKRREVAASASSGGSTFRSHANHDGSQPPSSYRKLRRRKSRKNLDGDELTKQEIEDVVEELGKRSEWEVLPEEANKLIKICELGRKKEGANKSAQLRFFSTSEDVEGANNDLEVEIEEAILSDCEKTINAIHHAVIWGDARIIRDQLEKSKQSDAAGLAHAFTTALRNAAAATDERDPAIRVAQELIRFHVDPRHVMFDEHLWERNVADQYGLLTEEKRDHARKAFQRKKGDGAQLSLGMHYLCELMPSVRHQKTSHYQKHLENRLRLLRAQQEALTEEEERTDCLKPEWIDLMMWAVLMGCEPLARLMWEQTKEPTRAAIMASRMCRQMAASREIQDRYDTRLLEQADTYEKWAIDILDSIDNENEARELLERVPSKCAPPGASAPLDQRRRRAKKASGPEAIYMWETSVLDEASQDDEGSCFQLVAHENVQFVRQTYYNASLQRGRRFKVEIVPGASWLELYLFVFTCGLSCASISSMKRTRADHESENKEMAAFDADDNIDLIDPDYRRLIDRQTDDDGEKRQTTMGLNTTSIELWWHSLAIPRVRFALHAAFLILYLLLLTTHVSGGFIGWDGNSPRHVTGRLRPQLWNIEGTFRDRVEVGVELAALTFTYSRWIEEAYQLKVMGGFFRYLSDGWNQVDVVGFFLMLVSLLMRLITWADGGTGWIVEPLVLNELLEVSLKHQALATIFAYARFLEVLSVYNSNIGLLVTTLSEMFRESLPVLYIMAALTVGFGVAFTGFMPFATKSQEVYSRPWAIPLWAMLGDFDLEAIQEQSSGFEVVLPTLVFLYTFTTTVFLVNLLIAQMTKSYERIINDGHSREYLEFQRLASVRDYKDTRTAPPPLNLIANFRGSIWLSVYFFLAIASGSVASYFIYTWGYPLLAPNWGSNAAFTVLHAATWLIALLGSMFVTLCIRLQNWLEGALCGNHNRPDKGFSVRATPAESHLTATKEHNYLKKALRKRKELDAQTTHRQIGDVRDGQQVLQNEQRLGLEQLNGRIDRIRRRFNDFEKHYKKNIHLILEKLDSDSPTAARNSSSGSLNNSNGSFNNTNDDAQSRSSSDAAPSRPDRLDMSFFSTSTSACSEAPASASPTKPPRVGVSAKKAQFADQVRLPVPQRSSSKIGSSSSSSSQAPAHEASPECNAMDISGVDGLDVLANVADGATRQPTVGAGAIGSARVRKNVLRAGGRMEVAQTLPCAGTVSAREAAASARSARSLAQTVAAAAVAAAAPTDPTAMAPSAGSVGALPSRRRRGAAGSAVHI